MVSRTLQTLTLVFLLTLVPATQALGAEAEPALADLSHPDADALPKADPLADAPVTTGRDVLDALPPIPECRPAVHVVITWWGGDILEEDSEEASWIQPETVVEEVVTQVPITKTVTEILWEPSGALGFLEPVTHEVTRTIGYEEEVEEVPHDLPLGVFMAWDREYVAWTTEVIDVYVTLPVGLPLLLDTDKEATLSQVCDPDTPILDHVPSADTGAYDTVCWPVLCYDPADGWYTDILSLDVWLATAEEMDLMPWRDDGLLIDGGTPLERADAAVAGFVDGYTGPFPDGTGDDADTDTDDGQAGISPDSATHVPVRTGLAVGGAVASLLGAALAGVMAMRRLRP